MTYIREALAVTRNRPTRSNTVENFSLAPRAELARIALPAAFVGKEMSDAPEHVAYVRAIVKDHDSARTKRQAGGAEIFKRQNDVKVFLNGERAGRAAHEHGL